MNDDLRAILMENYELRDASAWTAVFARVFVKSRKEKKVRIGKLMKNGEFQFTAGGLAESRAAGLAMSIENILKAEGLEPFRRSTTSGSRGVDIIYPAFLIAGIEAQTIGTLVDRVAAAYEEACS